MADESVADAAVVKKSPLFFRDSKWRAGLAAVVVWLSLGSKLQRGGLSALEWQFYLALGVLSSGFLWLKRRWLFRFPCWYIVGLPAVGQQALFNAFRTAGFTNVGWRDVDHRTVEATHAAGDVTGGLLPLERGQKDARPAKTLYVLVLNGSENVPPQLDAAIEALAEALRRTAARDFA